MNRRTMLGFPLGIMTACVTISVARAASNRNSARWVVPAGVKEINVKSWTKDGERVMNYDFDVEPGQIFSLTTK